MKLPTRIERFVELEYGHYDPARRAAIVDELLEAASEGPKTTFQERAIKAIFPEFKRKPV